MGFSQDLPGHSWRSVEQAPFCLFDLCKKKQLDETCPTKEYLWNWPTLEIKETNVHRSLAIEIAT